MISRNILSSVKNRYNRLCSYWKNFRHKEDVLVIIAIVFTAAMVRVPFINYPAVTVGDESIFEFFAVNTIAGQPFFEPQPPLGWMIYSLPARHMSPEQISVTKQLVNTNVSYRDYPYPYVAGRLISAFFGIMITLAVYLLARLLGLTVLESLVPAVLAVFDGGLILHSRLMMLESLWVGFGLIGLTLSIFTDRVESKKKRMWLFTFSAVFFGLSASVKWLGLGIFAAALIYLFYKRRYKVVLLMGVVVP